MENIFFTTIKSFRAKEIENISFNISKNVSKLLYYSQNSIY